MLPAVPPSLNLRRTSILEMIQHRGYVTIEALAAHFNTSQQTIRRDFSYLAERGLVERCHGGAMMAAKTFQQLPAERDSSLRHLAELAVNHIQPGMTVYLDSGEESNAVASALLASQKRCRVVSNNLDIAQRLSASPVIEAIIPGGSVKRIAKRGMFIAQGDLVMSIVRMFHYDIAFMSVQAFDDEGTVMQEDLSDVALKQGVIELTDKVIALSSQVRHNAKANIRVCKAIAFTGFICNEALPEWLADAMVQANVAVQVADARLCA
ncbi:DeoR/GlpR family DNA-binding transcription regulator [Paenalcaligenes sp. Me131]|uniref:DeoR/GlpR family DNA-binding transcription regulator n=1 Tax=Paenalcaligenes sp. Me131 TaxID=3392636 RepID=UPI003D273697